MDKAKLLEEFIEFTKDRHEKNRCDCGKHEVNVKSEVNKHDDDLSVKDREELQSLFDKMMSGDGSGFVVIRVGDKRRFIARDTNQMDIIATLVNALGSVLSEADEDVRPTLVDATARALKLFYGKKD